MSYAIIRNAKYKRENLKGIYRHNERKNFNYSNKNIDKEKSYLNYALKKPMCSYEKEFDRLKEEYNLRGNAENIVHLSVEDYKKVTGFNKTETILKDIKLKLLDIPNVNEFNKLSLNRDKKIEKENNAYIDVVKQYKYENDNQDEFENEYDEKLEI